MRRGMRTAARLPGALSRICADQAEAFEQFLEAHFEARFQVAARIQRHLDREVL